MPLLRADVSRGRRLVKKYAARPFALLGVNGDSLDTLQQLAEQKKVTWRCWADGRAGPIAQNWQVECCPALYLIDQDGIIRQVLSGAQQPGALERALIPVLDAAEAAGRRPGVPTGTAKGLAQ